MAGSPPLSPDAGPTDPHIPKLPSGWIAQWDSSSRKYYYVQISTGVSQWDMPTSEAPAGPTKRNESQMLGPESRGEAVPQNVEANMAYAQDGKADEYSSDRGLGSTALHLLAGQQQGKQSSGLGGLASSFLGGGHGSSSQGQSSGHGGSAGLVGQLASGLLGGNKPHGQQSQQAQQSSHQSSGLGSMLGGILGGSHGSHGQQNHGQQNHGQQNYGYSSSNSSGGAYTGSAPPAAYQPTGQHGSASTTSLGQQYAGQPTYSSYSSPSQQHGQFSAPQHSSSFGQPQQHGSPYGGPQHTPSFGQQGQADFPPPPTQHQGGYGSVAQHHGGAPHEQSGYFNQGQGQAHGYGQSNYAGANTFPPPPPSAQAPGGYTPSPISPHGAHGAPVPQELYGDAPSYNAYDAQGHAPTSGYQAYGQHQPGLGSGHGQGHNQGHNQGQGQVQGQHGAPHYTGAAAPPQPGW